MFKCGSCEHVFNNPAVTRQARIMCDPGEASEAEYGCPHCGSDDYEEAFICPICGEYEYDSNAVKCRLHEAGCESVFCEDCKETYNGYCGPDCWADAMHGVDLRWAVIEAYDRLNGAFRDFSGDAEWFETRVKSIVMWLGEAIGVKSK